MGKCEYLNCKNITRRVKRDKGSNLSFFRFPKEAELCKQWIEACQRDCLFDVGIDSLHKSHVVCGVHFKDFDFANPLTKKKLRHGAVPSRYSVSTVPKADFISSYGHYVVKNRYAKCTVPETEIEGALRVSPGHKHCTPKCEPEEESQDKKDMDNDHLSSPDATLSSSNSEENSVRDLACPQQLTNMAQNLYNLLPPISPTSSNVSEECSSESEDEENLLLSEPYSCLISYKNKGSCRQKLSNRSNPSDPLLAAEITEPSPALIIAFPTVDHVDGPPSKYQRILPKGGIVPSDVSTSESFALPTIGGSVQTQISKVLAISATVTINDATTSSTAAVPVSSGVAVNSLNSGDISKECICDLRAQELSSIDNEETTLIDVDVTHLMLDDNDLSDLPTIKLYNSLTELSLMNNKISCLHWFTSLQSLRRLNLSSNLLYSVEDINKLGHLTHIDLSNNVIKSLDEFVPLPVVTYDNVQYLNLSGNKIRKLVDLSALINLHTLKLDENCIKSMKYWKKYLPISLSCLSLRDNCIQDLTEFGELSSFDYLQDISIQNNPCFNVILQMMDAQNKLLPGSHTLDFRPFLIAKCPRLTVIDGRPATKLERDQAGRLITEAKILRLELSDREKVLSALSKYCSEVDPTAANEHSTGTSVASTPVTDHSTAMSVRGISDITYERNNHECFSASCSRNKNAIEEKSRQNYIMLIEERARNYKLQRENEALVEKVQLLEAIIIQNGLNPPEDVVVKLEVEPKLENNL